MLKNDANNIVGELKKLIDAKGPEHIFNEPFATYRHLSEACDKEVRTCAAILCVLVTGILRKSEDRSNKVLLSKRIQNECCFNSRMADYLAEIFSMLYSKENEEEWKNRELHGLKEFMNSEFVCEWEGLAVWEESNGSISCHYSANIELSPSNEKIIVKEIASLLKCNPLYEPVVEDFFVEDYTEEWCCKHGMEIVFCEGDGYDDGYEPDRFVGGWNY